MQVLPFFWKSSQMRFWPAGFAGLVVAWLPDVHAATWFDMYNPVPADKFTIEVDLDSLRLSGGRPKLLARILFEQPQRGDQENFRLVIASIEVECMSRQISLLRTSFHTDARGLDRPISFERRGTQASSPSARWLPEKAKQVLLQSVCGGLPDATAP